jgi:hypothetical protein
MALDAEGRKKLQIVLLLGIVIAGARAGYVVYERHEAMKEDTKPKVDTALKADYYVTPKKLHPYDLKSAKQLTEQPVWVKVGYYHTYYPYNAAGHKTDFGQEAGTLGPLQKIQIKDVVSDVSPKAAGTKQVMALFDSDGKEYAVPIGVEKEGDIKIYSDDIFFMEDPRDLYKHWTADVWKAIDERRVDKGMNELQASFAIGVGVSEGSGGAYGSRTLHYANGGNPMVISFENDKAVEIKAGS